MGLKRKPLAGGRESLVERQKRKRPKNQSGKEPLAVVDIEKIMVNRPYFAGIFDVSYLSKIFISSYPVCLIVLCDQHWISIYFGEKVEIFDSLGNILQSKYSELHSFIGRHTNGRSVSMIPKIQSDETNLCGYFAVYFMIMKCKQISFDCLLEPFSCDFAKNEQFVYKFIKKL